MRRGVPFAPRIGIRGGVDPGDTFDLAAQVEAGRELARQETLKEDHLTKSRLVASLEDHRAELEPGQRCTNKCMRENVPAGCIQSCGCTYMGFDDGYRWRCTKPENSECAGKCVEKDAMLNKCLKGCDG